ncbi:MAG: indole-3-glycerol phosphate synthase TrpC [Candidatus Omnitrophica bacterium]|nr:indole-3-glycerol phosphate synthase TrpC [Candidatus Omnitrophota bacterium]
MPSLLKNIVNAKQKEIREQKKSVPLESLFKRVPCRKYPLGDLFAALSAGTAVHCIGEVKKASPSKGDLNPDLDVVKTALTYEKSGISAISVLTDPRFKGTLTDLKKVKSAVSIPVLRKDFMLEEYQIYESYCCGADAVLLIAAILSKTRLDKLLRQTHALGMNAIIEIHDERDLEKVNLGRARIIGINNRNLNDFSVNMGTTERLIKKIPDGKIVVSESGINSRRAMLFLKKIGVHAALIGEGLVTAPDITRRIHILLGKKHD